MRTKFPRDVSERAWIFRSCVPGFGLLGSVLLLAACSGAPQAYRTANGRVWDPKLGVWSSPRLVADGEDVPRGGGSYLTGRPYVIGGRTYVPSQNPSGYTAVGTASWYGDAFHGRRTANGEIFDKGSISAAHPTLPLPSYVRVTNLKNGRSIVVRVNDRGPYHGGRVMDVSQRVAEALEFRGEGTAHVRIDYIGRAALDGSDDRKLMASLRTDGSPAQLDGHATASPVVTATFQGDAAGPEVQPDPVAQPENVDEGGVMTPPRTRRSAVPIPPARPFTLGDAGSPTQPANSGGTDQLAGLIARSNIPLRFAPDEGDLTLLRDGPFRTLDRQGTVALDAGSTAGR